MQIDFLDNPSTFNYLDFFYLTGLFGGLASYARKGQVR